MNCEHVQASLAFFLKGTLAAAERASLQRHLAECETCRVALGQLTGRTLQRLTAEVEPSPQAWSRLQSRLTKEAQPSPGRLSQWLSRLAPSGSTPTHFSGDNTMRKRIWLPALAGVIAIAIAVFASMQNVPAVSAQQILDRASAAQSAVKQAPGINHMRMQSYYNFQALDGDAAGTTAILDSYFDYQTGNLRNVTTEVDTGKVLNVFAYDGHTTYSTKGPLDSTASEPLIIYRTPQSLGGGVAVDAGEINFEQRFAELRADPQVKVEGKTTWIDGRTVYVLSTQQPGNKYLNDPYSVRTMRMFFDASTYQLLEEKATFELAGKEIVVTDVRYLVNETLPANSPVVWDLSDLQGVNFVDDVDRTQGDLLPEPITPQELAAHTTTGYLLKTIPAGFDLTIEAPPKQTNETAYIYIASYRTEENDYLVIQAGGAPLLLPEDTEEVYTTAAGLLVQFMPDAVTPEGKHYQNAVVKAPDGTAFMLTSTLPRERVKALAEDLMIVR